MNEKTKYLICDILCDIFIIFCLFTTGWLLMKTEYSIYAVINIIPMMYLSTKHLKY